MSSRWPIYPVCTVGASVSSVKPPATPLGIVRAPDKETARQQAIEFYSIPQNQQFRVVAVRIGGAGKAEPTA